MTDHTKSEDTWHFILEEGELQRLKGGWAVTKWSQNPRGVWPARVAFGRDDRVWVGTQAQRDPKARVMARIVDVTRVQRGQGAQRPQFTYYYTLLATELPERPWDTKEANTV